MSIALIPLLLAAALPGPAPLPSGVRVTAMATAEIVEPVTNDLRSPTRAIRIVSLTRDGRQFVEFQ